MNPKYNANIKWINKTPKLNKKPIKIKSFMAINQIQVWAKPYRKRRIGHTFKIGRRITFLWEQISLWSALHRLQSGMMKRINSNNRNCHICIRWQSIWNLPTLSYSTYMSTIPSPLIYPEFIRRGIKVVGNWVWFLRIEEVSQLGRQRSMTLTKTYTSDVNVRRLLFPICPYDIVAVTSYAENLLDQKIWLAHRVALTVDFTDKRDPR